MGGQGGGLTQEQIDSAISERYHLQSMKRSRRKAQ